MLGIRSEKLTGMAAMLVGVASFSFMDAGLKLLAAHYSATQVASLRGLAALPVVFAWSLYSGGLRQLVQVRGRELVQGRGVQQGLVQGAQLA